MAAIASPTPRFLDIGRVVQGTVRELQRRWVEFLLLSLVLWGGSAWAAAYVKTALHLNSVALEILLIAGGLTFLVKVVPLTLLYGWVTAVALADLDGRPATLGEILKGADRAVLPLLAIRLIVGIGSSVGLVLLIFPGVWLGLALSVAIPACLAEDLGVYGSLRRSLALTRDQLFRIFWLGLLYQLLAIVVVVVAMVVTRPFASGVAAQTIPQVPVLANVLAYSFLVPIVIVGQAVVFQELRRMREGEAAVSLASVFD